ncbi:14973_t:CDS:1, partial [Cetraspora pellucida]
MSQHLPLLSYRSNACSICSVCFVCLKIYGEDCLCQPIELNCKSKSSEYQQGFRNKYITRTGANKQKKKYDQ